MTRKRGFPVAVVVMVLLGWTAVALPAQGPPSWIPSQTEPGEGLLVRGFSPRSGHVTFASSPGRGILLPANAGSSPEARAKKFVEAYGRAFGLERADDVRLVRPPDSDELGMDHVRFQQTHRGIPVRGGEMVVHLAGPRVMAANGRALADVPDQLIPLVPADLAAYAARQMLEKVRPAAASGASYSAPALEILNRTLLSGIGGDRSRLAWFIEARGPALRQYIWIDAREGGVLLHFNQLPDAKQRAVHDAGHTDTLPGTLVRSEGGPATGDPDADNAYDLSGLTWDYFSSVHGRDSYDGAGATLVSTTHYCTDACPTYENAFWNGEQMVYGDGFASADDVVAHELTHAVTEFTAGLLYYMQSGALSESYSDIFGEAVDLTYAFGDDGAAARWLMGEDLPIGAIRSMSDPNLFSDPARMNDAAYFWCSIDGWTNPGEDGGGVHSNSGIPNKAFALMVDGGSFNGRTVGAIGLTKAAKVQYRTLTVYLTSGSGFLDNSLGLNQSCLDLIGTAGITAGDCDQVEQAVLAVEMDQPWGCAGAVQAPPMCPAGAAALLWSEGFEGTGSGSLGSFTAEDYSATGIWSPVTGFASTGAFSAWGRDPGSTSDHKLVAPATLLPPGARLYFAHAFEFETYFGTYYDGGVLEVSTNDGVSWTDAASLIDAGQGYKGTIDGTNPLGARTGFVGTSFGYTGTRLDLSSLNGQSVRFRFRIGSDSTAGSLGWLVDDIALYTCVVPVAWTDDPLVAGSTPVRKIHVDELRTRIDALRVAEGLGPFGWTDDPLVAAASLIRATHVAELRAALEAAYLAAGVTVPVWSGSAVAGGSIAAAHLTELRSAVVALE